MANVVYNSFKSNIGKALIDWENDAIKVMLVTSTYTPDIDTHISISDVTNEVVADGYTAGGALLSNQTVTVNTTYGLAKYDGDDVEWAISSITARAAVLYKYTGTPSTSLLVAYIDFGSDQSSITASFNIHWASSGIFTVS